MRGFYRGPLRRDVWRQKDQTPKTLSVLYQATYLSEFFTVSKVVFSFEPSPPTTAIMATEMPAAMSPYSIAVAPNSSFMKRANMAVPLIDVQDDVATTN